MNHGQVVVGDLDLVIGRIITRFNQIGTCLPDNDISTRLTTKGVVASAAIHSVIARAGQDNVVTATRT